MDERVLIKDGSLQLLHCLVQDVTLCIHLEYIQQAFLLPALKRVPSSPNYLVGLMNISGESIPVIDLALRLHLKRSALYTVNTPILLCSIEEYQIGILVEEVIGIVQADSNSLKMEAHFDKTNSPYLATVVLDTTLALLLNIHWVWDGTLLMTERN